MPVGLGAMLGMITEKSGGGRFCRSAVHLIANTAWRVPGSFAIARLLGPSYSLRCVVFHNISVQDSPFTRGMRVNTTPSHLEAKLEFLTKYYTPVRLDDILDPDAASLPARAILVTFDDAYASVLDVAAPLCAQYAIPAVFFVNAAFLDNQRLAPDNLVCYIANEFGMGTITAAVRAVMGADYPIPNSLACVFNGFFPDISLRKRETFLETLVQIAGINERRLASQAGLYLYRKQICDLKRFDFEIANHTYSHVHGRSLCSEDMASEIDRNKEELETLSGSPIRSFSVPYGSPLDLTAELARHLRFSGHKAVFLSQSVANGRHADRFLLDRVSTHSDGDESFFCEMEILPRVRVIRNRYFRSSMSVRVDRNSIESCLEPGRAGTPQA
jgi:peptidoglycan/xylan/chitin deacetylase (PgdA/CDA1 family)